MLLFAALTMNWFRVRCWRWEFALLALAVMLLFRPDALHGLRIAPEYRDGCRPRSCSRWRADAARPASRLVMVIAGTTLEGDDVTSRRLRCSWARRRRRRAQAPRRCAA
jgi:hypothetical protein